jgi:NAD(P) transhydrogenase subunit alpha
MIIGILKEIMPENRVALTPESVHTLTGMKAVIMVEKGAGARAYIDDNEYAKAGARLSEKKEILENAEIILTVNGLSSDQISGWTCGKILAGVLDPFNNKILIDELNHKRITSFSLELLPRTTLAQSMDILSSMATISGYRAVLEAAMNLPRFFPMFMTAAGTIKPAKVLILGAGVAGLQAIATARRLGAVVEVFDVRSAVKDEVHSLGGKFIEVEGAIEDKAAGGYAVEQTDAFRKKQSELIHQHALKSDVIICAAQIPGKNAPVLLTKSTIEAMIPGSVIIDLAASTGGNCALTKNEETIVHNGVKVIGRSYYPITMPVDASRMFSNNLTNFIRPLIDNDGGLQLDWNDEILKNTCLTDNGKVVHERIRTFYDS